MGVPVITRVGKLAVSRAGLSQLSNIGLADLAAETDDEFVQKAATLANDIPRLENLQAGHCAIACACSPLTDAKSFAADIENAYQEDVWSRRTVETELEHPPKTRAKPAETSRQRLRLQHMHRQPTNRSRQGHGFSLLELLIVISIIALLIAISPPVVANAAENPPARPLALANLQQWGQLRIRCTSQSNHGHGNMRIAGDYLADRRWWEWLGPFNGNVRQTLLCPEARERRSGIPGHARRRATSSIACGDAAPAWAMLTTGEDALGKLRVQPLALQTSQSEESKSIFPRSTKNAGEDFPMLG